MYSWVYASLHLLYIPTVVLPVAVEIEELKVEVVPDPRMSLRPVPVLSVTQSPCSLACLYSKPD